MYIIRDLREDRELSQAEIAKIIKTTQQHYSKIETGNANPALSTLKRLADGMDMVLKLEFVPKQSKA